MRIPAISTLIILLVACNGQRQGTTSGNNNTMEESAPEGMHHGTITTAFEAEGCPHLILLDNPPDRADPYLLPIGLDQRMLKDGVKLRFTYTPSRAPSGACGKGMPAVLENVTVR